MMTIHSLFFGVPATGQSGVPTAVPPWPWGTRALGQREILASQLRKAATKPAENSSQFAVWSLKTVNCANCDPTPLDSAVKHLVLTLSYKTDFTRV
jgi:hypothetical protein